MTEERMENIEDLDIKEIISTRFHDYSKYVLLSRAIPNAIDGLKPVQRRILYAMHDTNNTHDKPYRKSAKAVGEVMSNYHPHGDCLRGDTVVTLLNGETKTMEELYKEGNDVEILAVDKNNNIVPSVAHSFRIGQHTDKIYSVQLSNGEKLEMTGNHPVLLNTSSLEQKWVKTEELKVGDELFSGEFVGKHAIKYDNSTDVITITSIEILEVDQEPMYDFTVDEHENMLLVHGEGNERSFVVVHNSSIYEALARMSKEWVMPIPLIDMQGNNGSIDGDAPASMRYTEARLSKFVSDYMMSGIKKKGIVPMVDNFDDTAKEPVILPVQVPTILLMGNEGIGIGYSTSFPTFNLIEVVKACILHLENEEVTDNELFQILPAPDFSTGGVISNGKSLQKVLAEGRGRVVVRANYEVKQLTKKKKAIIFKDIPYEVNKSKLMMELDTIVADKKVNGMLKATDESGREDSVRIVVEISDEVEVNVVLGYLFKNTSLQSNINLNMVSILDNKPQVVGVFDIIRNFNKFRKETTLKELNYDLNTLNKRLEIVEGFIKLADIIGDVVQTIRASNGRADAKQNIINEYEFTELQAENIVGMALHRLSKTDADQYLKEQKTLLKNIKTLTKIISSDKLLTEYLIRNYNKIIEEYAKKTPRRTTIIPDVEDWTVRAVDVVQEEDTFVGVSKEGYIKRANRRSFNTTTKNGLIEGDEEILVEETTTKQFLMVFLSNGKYVYLPVHEIEDTRWGETGKHLSSYVDIGSNVHVINAFIVDEEKDLDKLILTVKSNGHVKRTPVKEHIVSRYGSTYDAIKIVAEEHLIGAYLHDSDKEYFIGLHADNNRTLQFSLNDVLPKGLRTQGMRGIHTDNEKGDSIKEHIVVEDISQMPKKYHVGNRGTKGKVFKK